MVEERILVVPIRRYTLNAPAWRRSKRAVSVLREFVMKHTKAKEVKLSRWVNEFFWAHGAKNPPGKVKVKVTKDKDDIVKVELAELPKRVQRINEKQVKIQEKKKKLLEKAKEMLAESKAAKEQEPNEEEKQKAKVSKQEEKFIH